MVEIPVKPEWIGKNLIELDLRKKYALNVVALINGEEVITNVDPSASLKENSKFIVIANTKMLKNL